MEYSGKVIQKPFAAGSKSDRQAVVLKTQDQEFVLRIQGGNPFYDARLESLVGKRIHAQGELHGYTFLIQDWTEV